MNRANPLVQTDLSQQTSDTARRRLLSIWGEPLFIADWVQVLMIHYEVEASALQRVIPFQLDLRQGRAYASIVAFTMRGMRPRLGGRLSAWAVKPIATHHFLNVRTYVRHKGEVGIYFMREWLSNRLSAALGPYAFGLPYRFANIEYKCDDVSGFIGRVYDELEDGGLAFRAVWNSTQAFAKCAPDSLCEWLMERYTAYTYRHGTGRFFRVWHPPWPQIEAALEIGDQSLLDQNWGFFREAKPVDGCYSPGAFDVWMGRPHRIKPQSEASGLNS